MIVWSCCGYTRAPPYTERVRWLNLRHNGVQVVPLCRTKETAIVAYDAIAEHRRDGHHWSFQVHLERLP